MTNTSEDTDQLILMINKEKSKALIPFTVYLTVLMVTGFVGNSMVCFFYGFKTKTTPTTVSIVALAVYDIISCTLGLPNEIVDTVHFYKNKPEPICKVFRLINYFSSIASILTLSTIAVDRHTLINRPSSKQMTVKDAKKMCVLLAGGAVLLSWPTSFVYDSISVSVPDTHGQELKAYDCSFTKKSSFKLYIWLFHISHALLFITCATVLLVLYGKVVYIIYKYRMILARYRQDISQVNNNQLPTATQPTAIDNSNTQNSAIGNPHQMPELQQSSSDNTRNETIRVTIVMIAITILFIVSYIPYLAAVIWIGITGKHKSELSNTQLLLFSLSSRSTYINSSFNPLLYGIFNRKFRSFFYRRVCCRGK